MTDASDAAERRSVARLMLREVWSNGDLPLIDELVSAEHIHHDPLVPEPIEGRQALKEWITAVRAGAPDLTKTVNGSFIDGDAVVVTYTTTGTHEGEIVGIAPTNRSFSVDGVYVFHLAEGEITETIDTWDAFGLFSQIGTFPEVA